MIPIARSALCRNVGSQMRRRGFAPAREWCKRPGLIKEDGVLLSISRIGTLQSVRLQGTIAENTPISTQSQHQSQPPPESPPKRSKTGRALTYISITFLCFGAGFAMAAQPAISTGVEAARSITHPITDAETLSLFQPSTEEIADIEKQIFSHPLTRSLLQDDRFIASRPHLKIPDNLRAQNLTGGTLLGADKIAVPPLQFTTEDGTSYVSLQWLGPALCGHPGIVHGGLLATLLDEGTARCCFPALPNKVAVTASLKVDYKAPCMAGQIVVLRAETTKVEGRKAWVKGRLESLVDESKGEKPVVFTEAEALFIEPRGAEKMRKVVVT